MAAEGGHLGFSGQRSSQISKIGHNFAMKANVVLVFIGELVFPQEKQIYIFISSFIKMPKVAFSEQIFLKYIQEYDVQDSKGE